MGIEAGSTLRREHARAHTHTYTRIHIHTLRHIVFRVHVALQLALKVDGPGCRYLVRCAAHLCAAPALLIQSSRKSERARESDRGRERAREGERGRERARERTRQRANAESGEMESKRDGEQERTRRGAHKSKTDTPRKHAPTHTLVMRVQRALGSRVQGPGSRV